MRTNNMTHSDTISKIAASLKNAQTNTGKAVKGSSNPFFKNRYADLGAVIESFKEAFNAEGITVMQPVEDGKVFTLLIHESGEWIQDGGTPIVCTKQNDPQAQGSAITYARRYGLSAMLLIPAADDDGEGATNHTDQATMYQIDSCIKKCQELFEKNNDPNLEAVITGLKLAKAGKKSLTGTQVESWKERAIEKLSQL